MDLGIWQAGFCHGGDGCTDQPDDSERPPPPTFPTELTHAPGTHQLPRKGYRTAPPVTARHIYDKRCASAGGGYLVECACRSTSKHADPDKAVKARRRLNRPTRSARPASVDMRIDIVLQLQLGLAERSTKARCIGGHHGRS